MLAKDKAAELGEDINFEAEDLLRRYMYVGDLLGGGTWEQGARYRGDQIGDEKFNGTLPQILSKVGLTAKVIIVSGECDPKILEKCGGKVLGHTWEPQADKIKFDIIVNLSEKNKKGERLGPDLTTVDIGSLGEIRLTKRKLLGFVMGIFDPTGLISPITVKLKLELHKLFKLENTNLGWDETIPKTNKVA